jgi:predicted HTH transcriptional regulator
MEYDAFLEQRRTLMADVVRAAFERLRTGEVPFDEGQPLPAEPHAWTVEDLLEEMESDRVEFKSSAYYSYKPDIPERIILESVLKTVAGFFNAGGGTLAIGIADDGEILGIQPDLERKNFDTDGYVNSLTTAFERALGPVASARTKIQLQTVEDSVVCLVHVPSAPEPVYAKVSKGEKVFFVRMNNSTRVLSGPDLVSYVKERLGVMV